MKNKFLAAIFAIFFGWLGFHKFYLGKWVQGIFYIILTIVSVGVITVPLSILEGIRYALLKKDDFDIEYNVDYMQKQDYLNNRK